MTAGGPIAVGTVFAKNYLSFARVLAASFRRHHPNVPFVGVLADEPQGRFAPEEEPFRVVELGRLGIPALESLAFRYPRFELSVTAKSYLLEHLLDEGYESALFLDVDTLVLGDLSELIDWTRSSAITLVPHVLAPLGAADRAARELNILQSGVMNGGVVGVSDCEPARRFLAWWRDRVTGNCRHSLAEGLHFDQRWLDFAAVYFPGVQLYRDPRVNIAHWNLPERLPRKDWRLFHFSGYRPDQPNRVTLYSDRVAMNDELGPLFSEYQRALADAGWQETTAWPYAYDHWDNGVKIPDVVRELYGDLGGETVVRFGDPFQTASPTSFFHWLNQPLDGDRRVTHLWAQILRRRPDVLQAYPDALGADREGFLAWTRLSGAAEHEIPEALMRA